jgi:hypothetical protein
MPSLRDLFVQVGFNFDKEKIKEFDKSISSVAKKANAIGEMATRMGQRLSLLVTLPLAGISAGFIKAASDAEETSSKFATVFKDIGDSAQKTARDLALNFGLASTKAKELLGDTGDILTGFGFTQESALDLSEKVNKLAVDLASFTNYSGGAEGASKALTKALIGEREMVKSLGIAILEEDVKKKVAELRAKGLTFETERQAKAYATLEIALSQSKNAVGDFARTSHSFANQSRIMRSRIIDVAESFGNILLPIATKIVQKLTVILEKVTNFSDSTKKMILIAGALAAALGPLLIIFGTLSTGIFAAATAMKILGITSLGAAAKTILAWLGAAAPFVAFVALLTSLFLIAEDFYAYLSGKDSITEMVIGPLQEFKDFISDFLTFEGSLRNISVIMSTIFDMLKYIPGFKVAGAFSKSFQNLAANVGTVQPISRNVSNYSSQNVRVNSPITVNVPRGTDPEVIGPVVQESFKNALDSVFRQAYRATAPQQEF